MLNTFIESKVAFSIIFFNRKIKEKSRMLLLKYFEFSDITKDGNSFSLTF